MPTILLIEDDPKKVTRISEFLKVSFPSTTLVVKESYQSGLRELLSTTYDLLLLDMSMPTWDRTLDEPGGEFEKFAGIMIMNELVRKNKTLKTILITMFDYFGMGNKTMTLNEMDAQLKNDFNEFYIGAVFYSSAELKWQDELSGLIKISGV